MAFRLISLILSLSLFCQQAGIAYASGELNLANYLSSMRNAVVQPDVFQPPRLRYISYDSRNNDFKLLLDKGDAKLNNATQELFNYFLIGLALPNDTFWVNLRPDAPENIIDPLLEKTDIGKIFLEADLQLKKDTANLTSPQNPEGKLYWDKLYNKAGELFGSENITIPTITRPWIVPNEVIVRETEDSAYIYKATLKVMLEADYLKSSQLSALSSQQYNFKDSRLKELNEYSSQIIRETIIPKLTREVNSSKRYAKLRQVYYSLVLSRWFKQKYSSLGSARASEHQNIGASANSYLSLIDSVNLDNLTSQEPCDKQAYFQAYQKSFGDGEYNLKETVASPYGQSIRSYISGGIGMNVVSSSAVVKVGDDNLAVTPELTSDLVLASSSLEDDLEPLANKLVKVCRQYNEGWISLKDAALGIIKHIKSAAEKIIRTDNADHIPYLVDWQAGDILILYLKTEESQMMDAIDREIAEKIIRELKGLKKDSRGVPYQGMAKEIVQLLRKAEEIKKKPIRPEWIEIIVEKMYLFDEGANKKQKEVLDKLIEEIEKFSNVESVRNWWEYRGREELKKMIRPSIRGKQEQVIEKIEDLIKHQEGEEDEKPETSGSLIEVPYKTGKLVFWNGGEIEIERQAKETILKYVRGDKLEDGQLQSVVLWLKGYVEAKDFWESKIGQLNYLIEGIKNKDKELLSNLRFALSENGGFQGCVEILKKKDGNGNLAYVMNLVIGMNQWIEVAIAIAGIQELADSAQASAHIASIALDELWMNNTYTVLVLYQLGRDKLPPYNGSFEISQKDVEIILNEFYQGIQEEIEKKKYLLSLIKQTSASPVDLISASSSLGVFEYYKDDVGDGIRHVWEHFPLGLIKTVLSVPIKEARRELTAGEKDALKKLRIAGGRIMRFLQSIDENTKFIVNLSQAIDIIKLTADTCELESRLNARQNSALKQIKEDLEMILGSYEKQVKAQISAMDKQKKGIEIVQEFVTVKDNIRKIWFDYKNKYLLCDPAEEVRASIETSLKSPGVTEEFAEPLRKFLEKLDAEDLYSELQMYNFLTQEKIREFHVILRNMDDSKDSEKLKKCYRKIFYEWKRKYGESIDNKASFSKTVSSSLEFKPGFLGGIDLTDRFMRLKIERTGGFADLKLFLPQVQNAQGLDLDREFRQIEAIASSGVVPNSRRILELFSACYLRGEFGRRLPQVISALKSSSAIQESLAIDSDDDFRLALIVLEALTDGR